MNNIYLYDSSFSSLIKLILNLIENNTKPYNILSEENEENLFDNYINLKLNKTNIKIDKNILKTSYLAFLSENEYKELIIYYFIKNSLKYKNKIYYQRNLKCVNKIIKISKYVSNEAHKYKGFVRFTKTKNNFYYAKIKPINNVLPILINHFIKRLNEKFVIYDENREIYAFYDLKKVYYISSDEIINLNLDNSTDEENIEDLWKTFFNTVSIKERKNEKCQMNFMPKRYWENMIEMEDRI